MHSDLKTKMRGSCYLLRRNIGTCAFLIKVRRLKTSNILTKNKKQT